MSLDYSQLKPVVILDFGSQYTQLIARRIRKMGVYSLIVPFNTPKKELEKYQPGGIILSGGPSSIYEKNAPRIKLKDVNFNVPILGICYGMQLINFEEGGKITPSEHREYGHTPISHNEKSKLFEGTDREFPVWMSHGDRLDQVPPGYHTIAESENAVAAFENPEKNIFGLQFHPEVVHTSFGTEILENFVLKICELQKNWSLPSFIDDKIKEIRDQVGSKKVVLGLSGGVDSSVLAVLLHKAIGDQLTCVFINNGVLRKGEAEQVQEVFARQFQMKLVYVDATEGFLKRLRGKDDPEKKRKIIGKHFVKVFFKAMKGFDFLAQGTLYPDVIESVSTRGPSDKIKTHHNRVDKILELKRKGRIIEPFEELFKDEVREIGAELKVPKEIIERHPFPGPGLAIRIMGAVSKKRIDILQRSDAIVMEEITAAGIYNDFWQAFAVLLPVRTVGVMGDQRTYGYTIALRMVESVDGMTSDYKLPERPILTKIANRIIGQVKEVNRVVFDVTSKPPGTIEWE